MEMTVTHAAGNAESSESQPVEMCNRMEDVLVSRKRGAEEMGPPDDGSCEVGTILMSLGVAPVNFNVAELFCSNRFGDAAVDMGFERGLVVDYATGWDVEDEEKMKEIERRVVGEEPVWLIGSPMCRSFIKLIDLTRVTGRLDAVKHKDPLERCVGHLRFCFKMYEVQRNAGRMFVHETPWTTWSWDLSFLEELRDK